MYNIPVWRFSFICSVFVKPSDVLKNVGETIHIWCGVFVMCKNKTNLLIYADHKLAHQMEKQTFQIFIHNFIQELAQHIKRVCLTPLALSK